MSVAEWFAVAVAAAAGAIYSLRRPSQTGSAAPSPAPTRSVGNPILDSMAEAIRKKPGVAVLYDEAKIDRSVNFERQPHPDSGKLQCL